jgi:hypothetical protein
MTTDAIEYFQFERGKEHCSEQQRRHTGKRKPSSYTSLSR